ncbi:hypothetical protein EVAR_21139_1 [Eumeta japonica]|uniref:Uncharacterized protein n=1 Tax=Eumeta variegata TaxID=151549 RepID=A0A4C1VWD4_EUMVA|nr:hypothetical protein EVAR_21139_1 [Eumeta japonica]
MFVLRVPGGQCGRRRRAPPAARIISIVVVWFSLEGAAYYVSAEKNEFKASSDCVNGKPKTGGLTRHFNIASCQSMAGAINFRLLFYDALTDIDLAVCGCGCL